MTKPNTEWADALQGALHNPEVDAILAGGTTEGTDDESEATEESADESPAELDTAEVDEEVAPIEANGESEVPADEVEDTDDTPTSYFGMDLSEYTPEQRRDIITKLSEQNQLISKLQRDRSLDEVPVEDEPVLPAEVSDADLLTALGLDPEDPFDENTAKVALPLARQLLDLKAQVEGVVSDRVIEDTGAYWDQGLDALEAEFGELPLERLAVLEYAADNGLSEPQDAYWRLAGPARAQLARELERRQKTAKDAADAKRKVATPVRSSGAGNATDAPVEEQDVESATRSVAKRIAKDLGLIN